MSRHNFELRFVDGGGNKTKWQLVIASRHSDAFLISYRISELQRLQSPKILISWENYAKCTCRFGFGCAFRFSNSFQARQRVKI